MSETEIVHFGVKGMKWGIRKSEPSVSKSKKVRTPEEEARRKKILKGIGITAGILAVAGISYLTYDQIQLNKLKGIASIGETNFENIKKSPHGDALIQKGADFTRRSMLSNASWPTKVRTYAVEGADSDLIKRYGSNVYKFKTNQAVKVAGLRSQMDILQSDHARALAKPLSKELAPMSLSGKLYIQKMSPEKFSKFTIESLRRSAWDGSEIGTSAETYANLLKRHGYSAVNDLNLPGSAARVLLDKNVFDLVK